MTKIQRRIATGIATLSMLMNASMAFASTELVISGNGSDSDNQVQVQQSNNTWVTQTNVTDIQNHIDVNADTGGNTAEDNTGGDVHLETGDASAKVMVDNLANSNVAEVESCDCADDTLVKIEGNGTGTDNTARLQKAAQTNVFQTNVAKIDNKVNVDAETGDNDAEDNTGGDVVILTGDADTEVYMSTMANMNSASVKPAGNGGGSIALLIGGNGSDSDNAIGLKLDRSVWLDQLNLTDIENKVDVDAETGENDAEDNTGGLVGIGTGDAYVKVMVDNMAGFNSADVEDCCFGDVLAKLWGNGTDSDQIIKAELTNDLTVWQDNFCGSGYFPMPQMGELSVMGGDHFGHHAKPCFDNNVSVDAETGDNTNEDNTGAADGDPIVDTGDSDIVVGVSNTGGSNVFGSSAADPGWDWPEWPSMGFNLSISFDLEDLLAALLG